MLLFEYILILLFAIFLSNIINRFLPSVSVTIIQIALGAVIALLPLDDVPELDPRLFFVLFIAPLVFYSSMLMDRKSFWKQKGPIMNMAFILVFVTVIGVGFLIHSMIPAIPLVAAFVLIAALAPTDDVAVASVARRVNVPPKIMNILSGESIMNDASGIVCFQFAVAAVMTGSFSVTDATVKFIFLGLGGVVVGLLLTLLKYLFVRWIRSLGMENVTLHVLIELLTPFLVYMVAEHLEVSGILAIFTAGISHSLGRKELNPDNVKLNIAAHSIWNVFAFTLEGLVFLILGTQLPAILETVGSESYPVSPWAILFYVLVITLIFAVSRFVWSYFTIPQKAYSDPKHEVSKFRASMIFSLSGARGAVTLASAMSIPILLTDGSAFPQRDLIILIATGVILLSLILTSFVLPLFVEKETGNDRIVDEDKAYVEILNHVIRQLSSQVTSENRAATRMVTREYLNRIRSLQNKNSSGPTGGAEKKLREQIFEWKEQNILGMMAQRKIDEYTGKHFLDMIGNQKSFLKGGSPFRKVRKAIIQLRYLLRFGLRRRHSNMQKARIFVVKRTNDLYVLEKLNRLAETDHSPVVREYISYYELSLSMQKNMGGMKRDKQDTETQSIEEVASAGLQIERDCIQTMFEEGRISRDTAKKMRNNILLLETQLKMDS